MSDDDQAPDCLLACPALEGYGMGTYIPQVFGQICYLLRCFPGSKMLFSDYGGI